METLKHRLGIVTVGFLMVVCVMLLPALVSALMGGNTHSVHTSQSSFLYTGEMSSSANAVTRSMTSIAQGTDKVISGTATVVYGISDGFVWGATHVGAVITSIGTFFAHSIYSGSMAVVSATSHTFFWIAGIPGSLFEHIAKVSVVSAMIQPADHADSPPLNIDRTMHAAANITEKTAPKTTVASLASAAATAPKKDTMVRWPIHGMITTLFGVPEPPYQPIHTGIDISDGKPSGVTAIHPFKAGRVMTIEYSSRGLGNHVVIDHGNGLSSVYAHLYSIAVQQGDSVTVDDIIGREGSTGVSTGTHLHFEILRNGTPTNPFNYIDGRP